MNEYDVIVIGGGHNGLTAAAMLAGSGRKVLLLERRKVLGGIAASEEFHSGYRTAGLLQDTGLVRSEVVDDLNLHEFGLRATGRPAPVTLLSESGTSVTIDGEPSSESIRTISPRDADSYTRYLGFIESVRDWVAGLLNQPQPDIGNLSLGEIRKLLLAGIRLRQLGSRTMTELLKVLPMSVADFLNEYFETDFIKAGIALPSIIGTFNGPWSSYTAMNLILRESLNRNQVIGGPAALVSALEQSARKRGVEIRTSCAAERILLDQSGRVRGIKLETGEDVSGTVVAASCTPRETFLRLLQPKEIGPKIESEIIRFRCRGTAVKMNIALNGKIRWKTDPSKRIEFARTGNSFDDTERAFDAIKYRKFSAAPVLDISVPTVSDPSLAPEGHDVVSVLAGFAPCNPEGGWTDQAKKQLEENILGMLKKHTVGLEESVVATEVITPGDMEERYGLAGGDMYHGEQSVDQIVGRPIPSCSGSQTPIPGLYLCGSGSHPGGGITCAPGALSARAIRATAD